LSFGFHSAFELWHLVNSGLSGLGFSSMFELLTEKLSKTFKEFTGPGKVK